MGVDEIKINNQYCMLLIDPSATADGTDLSNYDSKSAVT